MTSTDHMHDYAGKSLAGPFLSFEFISYTTSRSFDIKTPIDRRQTSISRFPKLSREFLLPDRNTAHVFYFLIVKAKLLRTSDIQQLNFSTTASLGQRRLAVE